MTCSWHMANALTPSGVPVQTGFLSGRQKESMFAVPEGLDGKVGVIGSGKGMTEAANPGRHDFDADNA